MSDEFAKTVTFGAGSATRTQAEGAALQRRLLIGAGVACTCLLGVTMLANAIFASKFGANAVETGLMIVGALGVDTLKGTLLLPIANIWRHNRPMAMMGFALWLACFSWSLFSAYGFVVSLRTEKAAETGAALDSREAIGARLRRQEAQLAALPRYRPAGSLQAAVTAEERRLGITAASGDRCARNTNWARENCGTLRALREELASAESAAAIEASIRRDRAELSGIHVSTTDADPQIQGMSAMTGIAQGVLTAIATIFFAALLEAASAIGPVITATGARYARETPEEEPVRDVPVAILEPAIGTLQDGFNRWCEFIEIDAGARTSSKQAYGHYSRWAPFAHVDRGTPESFGKLFRAHAMALGAAAGRDASGAHYTGIGLRSEEPVKLLRAAQ